jgi:hypothetical protein
MARGFGVLYPSPLCASMRKVQICPKSKAKLPKCISLVLHARDAHSWKCRDEPIRSFWLILKMGILESGTYLDKWNDFSFIWSIGKCFQKFNKTKKSIRRSLDTRMHNNLKSEDRVLNSRKAFWDWVLLLSVRSHQILLIFHKKILGPNVSISLKP